ncbi:MAG: phenylalanine 4-monooxygenase [Gammaproteobacteria bacterium]|nr:phenylalanine 4-monooxygenase [Gammaproteobacteria bacterium]
MGTTYVAKQPDENGFVQYTDEENKIWAHLYERQMKIIQDRACDEYFEGIQKLGMAADRIPQIPEINKVLNATTGWGVEPVAALINFETFFNLLANKKFPVATFIRSWEELDYLQEPDVFHEIFGHCAMLTNPHFAEFTHTYGKLGQAASKEDRVFLARLYWFTVEFGLMQTEKGLRIYGGGILSSKGETIYCLDDPKAERTPFDVLDVLRTPYRIDIMQPQYFVINSLMDLHELAQMDLMAKVQEAKALGLHAPKFPPKEKKAVGAY